METIDQPYRHEGAIPTEFEYQCVSGPVGLDVSEKIQIIASTKIWTLIIQLIAFSNFRSDYFIRTTWFLYNVLTTF
jgi:hypothetical protein